MTRIKKLKGVYPATIAQAVKDANFKKSGGAVMTQSEINKTMRDDFTNYTASQRDHIQQLETHLEQVERTVANILNEFDIKYNK